MENKKIDTHRFEQKIVGVFAFWLIPGGQALCEELAGQ